MYVVVSGLPGSGKTTIAAPLAEALGLPLLARDSIKESLWDTSVRRLAWSRRLGVASAEAFWRLAAEMRAAVLDKFFHRAFAHRLEALPGPSSRCTARARRLALERYQSRSGTRATSTCLRRRHVRPVESHRPGRSRSAARSSRSTRPPVVVSANVDVRTTTAARALVAELRRDSTPSRDLASSEVTPDWILGATDPFDVVPTASARPGCREHSSARPARRGCSPTAMACCRAPQFVLEAGAATSARRAGPRPRACADVRHSMQPGCWAVQDSSADAGAPRR